MKDSRIRSVLAVVTNPFSNEQLALNKGAAIAQRSGARLTLLNTFMIPEPVTDVPMDSQRRIIESAKKHRRTRIEQLAAKWRKRGVKIKVLSEWDYPAHEAIVRAVLRERPDLVVAESHRHGTFARWLLANTDWELIRHCPCDVWFVRGEKLPARQNILVAVDPFHAREKPARLDDRLLQAAERVAGDLGGQVAVAHAYHAPVTSTSGSLSEPFRWPRAASVAREHAVRVEKTVNRLAERYEIPSARRHLIEGEPAAAIAKFTKTRGTDLLVMGAVSRSAVQRAVLGNTAEKVIDAVGCDVLVVKPRGFKTSVPKVRPR